MRRQAALKPIDQESLHINKQAACKCACMGSKSVPCAYGWLPAQHFVMQVWSLENRKDEALQP